MTTRRTFLRSGLAAGAVSVLPVFSSRLIAADPAGPFKLPPLPYAPDALEPHIDAETMTTHHDKHHAGYVAKLNEALAKTGQNYEGTLPELKKILSNLDQVPEEVRTAVRNNGGGHYNHTLFWESLSPKGAEPRGDLLKSLEKQFGSTDKFLAELQAAGLKVFGSGWAWLVYDPAAKSVAISTTPNQDTPLAAGHVPLLGIDVWEHAYYLKYKNRRADYLKAISNVINWEVVAERHSKATSA